MVDTDKLSDLLNPIYINKVEVKPEEREKNLTTVNDVVEALLPAMKKVDSIFDELYSHTVYTGSAFEGLQVKSARAEFDLNWVLKLPRLKRFEEPAEIRCNSIPGFVQLYVDPKEIEVLKLLKPKWMKFFDKDGCLLRSEVQNWVQGVVKRAVDSPYFKLALPKYISHLMKAQISDRQVISFKPKNLICEGHCSKTETAPAPRKHGPAFKWTIVCRDGRKIDVDLVPVLDPGCVKIPDSVHQSKRFKKLETEHKKWYMIPKEYEMIENPETYWRLAFPEAEKNLLRPSDCPELMIKLIKLFKFLRDCHQNWQKLCSYYIKTRFLLELDEIPTDDQSSFLQLAFEDKLGAVFMMMLKELEDSLRHDGLKCYFNREMDLLERINRDTRENYANRIKRIIEKVTYDPNNINKFMELKKKKKE